MKNPLLLFIPALIISCKGQDKTDLSKLKLNELIENVIDFNDEVLIGIETVEYPFCLLLEIENSGKYNFDGINLEGQNVIFQISSEKLKTDSITRFGGGHVDLQPLKNVKELNETLKKQDAENKIYGVRIEMKTQSLKTEILKKLEAKYGKGVKNPNTDNGLYWSIKKEHKFIFYAPDYERLIILNNINLSKTCYWDTFNGLIDFGGCNNEKYTQELVKNSTKPEDVKNKPILIIDKNWNINGLILGKTNEFDFVKSKINTKFEKMLAEDSDLNLLEVIYRDEYHDLYFNFASKGKNAENQRDNILKSYSFQNFKKVEISFENGLKAGMKYEDVIKLFDKNDILNYADLKISNYIEIKNTPYKVTLYFDEEKLFSGIYVQ
ncbi:hypothetical protein [Flavobacterium sp.]|uniref:hypothetical protein n=1 Tax=Flavobacterium sp. TaxID=239 RepID=UPI002B83367C|nr:hypothetical protein [Flavobacterium sp.]HSD09122.1 hypothetical protein [Flavobacterium sp.]